MHLLAADHALNKTMIRKRNLNLSLTASAVNFTHNVDEYNPTLTTVRVSARYLPVKRYRKASRSS